MTVFEASNETLKEYFLFLSTRPLGEVIYAHCARPPRKIAHWKRGHAIFYTEAEILPGEAEAWEFVERHVGLLERTGWKVLV